MFENLFTLMFNEGDSGGDPNPKPDENIVQEIVPPVEPAPTDPEPAITDPVPAPVVTDPEPIDPVPNDPLPEPVITDPNPEPAEPTPNPEDPIEKSEELDDDKAYTGKQVRELLDTKLAEFKESLLNDIKANGIGTANPPAVDPPIDVSGLTPKSNYFD